MLDAATDGQKLDPFFLVSPYRHYIKSLVLSNLFDYQRARKKPLANHGGMAFGSFICR
jgi:hypothetical protein